MARRLSREALRTAVIAAVLATVAAIAWFAWNSYREQYVVTEPDEGGPVVSQVVTATLAGMSSLKVAELSGTVQATASDIRGFGWLRSDQVVKMPYSVDYFVDVSRIGAGDVTWNEDSRTLVVDAPDIQAARPNTDEGRRTLVRTSGMFVTREAGEELARRTSQSATRAAEREAVSPQRMAQAREHGRRAMAALMGTPLASLGYGDARVIVTFPSERGRRIEEQWDTSRRPEDVIANRW